MASPAQSPASTPSQVSPPRRFLRVFWRKAAPHLFASKGEGWAGLSRPGTQRVVMDAGTPLRHFYSISKGMCPVPQTLQAVKGRGAVPILQIRRLSKLLV